MYVREVCALNSKKSRVKFDTGESIVLYKGEIRKYNIEADTDMNESDYTYIMNELLPKRCRERAMYIIERSDKTRKQIADKLRQNGYPDSIIDGALEFLDKYDYVDDNKYAKSYINAKSGTKSRRQIEYELNQRGICTDALRQLLGEEYSDEVDTIKKLLYKRRYSENLSADKSKHVQYLMRKGFSYDNIQRAMNEFHIAGSENPQY